MINNTSVSASSGRIKLTFILRQEYNRTNLNCTINQVPFKTLYSRAFFITTSYDVSVPFYMNEKHVYVSMLCSFLSKRMRQKNKNPKKKVKLNKSSVFSCFTHQTFCKTMSQNVTRFWSLVATNLNLRKRKKIYTHSTYLLCSVLGRTRDQV